MKPLFFIVLLGVGFYFANQDTEKQHMEETAEPLTEVPTEQVSATQSETAQLVEGVRKVVAVIEELKVMVNSSPDNVEDIQALGKGLAEEWDKIEKDIEEQYPEDYKNIEDSLYPLIAYAQNDAPDIEKIKQLIKEVLEKLTVFADKL